MPELQPFPLITRTGRRGRVFRASRFLDRSNVNRVEFDDGTSTTVLASELHVNPDGTFVLDDEPSPGQAAQPETAPAREAPAASRGSGFLGNVAHGPADRGPKQDTPREEARPEPPPARFNQDEQEETLAMETSAPETAVNQQPQQTAAQPQAPAPTGPERIQRAPSDRHIMLDEPLFGEDVDVQRVAVNRLVDGRPETRQEGDTTVIPVVEEVITIQKRLLLREEVRITRRRVEVREPRRVMVDGEGTQVVGSDGRNIDLK